MNAPFTDTPVKCSFLLDHRYTSTTIELWVWQNLMRMAGERGLSRQALIQEIHDRRRRGVRLSVALRAAVAEDLMRKAFGEASPTLVRCFCQSTRPVDKPKETCNAYS
jgi:predicted DNA-binding ribbon-helix-helix protein